MDSTGSNTGTEPMAAATITLRLTIADPVVGVAYSLQDKANTPVGPRIAGDGRSVSTRRPHCPTTAA